MIIVLLILNVTFCSLFFKFAGSPDQIKSDTNRTSVFAFFGSCLPMLMIARARLAEAIAKKYNGSKFTFSRNDKEAEDIWYSRKVRFLFFSFSHHGEWWMLMCLMTLQVALWSAIDYVPGAKCWTTDVCKLGAHCLAFWPLTSWLTGVPISVRPWLLDPST